MFALALGLGDALTLTFLYERPLELGHGPDDLELEPLEGIILAGEGKPLLEELDRHAFARELPQEAQEVLEVAGQPVDGMDVQGVAFADVIQTLQKLWPGRVRCAGLVLEHLVQSHALKLPVRLLVDGADSHVPDVRHVHVLLEVVSPVASRKVLGDTRKRVNMKLNNIMRHGEWLLAGAVLSVAKGYLVGH